MTQIVSIDSIPRGLAVSDPDDPESVLGVTPLFLRTGRAREKAFRVESSDGKGFARWSFRCGFRFSATLLGNSPLILAPALVGPQLLTAGLALYGLGVTTDVVAGAARQCPERYLFDPRRGVALNPANPRGASAPSEEGLADSAPAKPPRARNSEGSPKGRACRRYFVVPPYHPEEHVSRAFESAWREAAAAKLAPCDTIVPSDESRSFLQRYGISGERALDDVSSFSVTQTNAFGHRTGATHLVLVRGVATLVGDRESLQLAWTIYDLHSRARVGKGSKTDPPSDSSLLKRSLFTRALSWTFGLIPNSVGFSLGRTVTSERPRGEVVALEDAKDKPTLPAYLANWTLLSVYHPYQYPTWALDWDFRPEATSAYVAREIDLVLPAGRRVENYQVDTFTTFVLMNLSAILHSPLGAFAVSYGMGPGFVLIDDNQGRRKTTVRLHGALQANYTAFMTENVFLRAAIMRVGGNGRVTTERVSTRLTGTASLTLGLFIPEARSWMRSLL